MRRRETWVGKGKANTNVKAGEKGADKVNEARVKGEEEGNGHHTE